MSLSRGYALYAFATLAEAQGVFPQMDLQFNLCANKVAKLPDCRGYVAVLGVGSVAFSANLSAVLMDFAKSGRQVCAVVALGICGAYPASGIQVGQAVRVVSETVGDLGYHESDGSFVPWASASTFECDESLLERFGAFRSLPAVKGLTVNCCTGTAAEAQTREDAFGCQVESMEGAAAVSLCKALGVPVMEIRAVSNIASTRDKSKWKISEALEKLRELFNYELPITNY